MKSGAVDSCLDNFLGGFQCHMGCEAANGVESALKGSEEGAVDTG